MASKMDLSAAIDSVIAEAEDMARQTAIPKSKSERTKNIRDNRQNEKEANRREETFVLNNDDSNTAGSATTPQTESEPVSPALAMIIKQLEERLNEK